MSCSSAATPSLAISLLYSRRRSAISIDRMQTLTEVRKRVLIEVLDTRQPDKDRLILLDDVDHLLREALGFAHLDRPPLLDSVQHFADEQDSAKEHAVALLAHFLFVVTGVLVEVPLALPPTERS